MSLEEEIAVLNKYASAFGGIVKPWGDALKFGYPPDRPAGPIGTYTTTLDKAGVVSLQQYLLKNAQALHTLIPGLWEQSQDLQLQQQQREKLKFERLHF